MLFFLNDFFENITYIRYTFLNPSSAGNVHRRQILTYKDHPRTERFKIGLYVMAVSHDIGIQIKRQEQTFMMI